MILIADSGSTKTDWALISSADKSPIRINTAGINPYFQNVEDIIAIIEKAFGTVDITEIDPIYFYGAGCSDPEKCKIVERALNAYFKDSKVIIEHDMLGAARALCGRKPGIAAIIGTGSNSCYYSGSEITEHIRSLGFILGDEGSGAYLGKKLITDYLNGDLPFELRKLLNSTYTVNHNIVLDHIYKKPNPNRYLGSFAPFLLDHQTHPYIKNLLTSSFDDFFIKHIRKYTLHLSVPVHIVGSIGFHFQDTIREVALSHQVSTGTVLRSPMEGLISYHLTEAYER